MKVFHFDHTTGKRGDLIDTRALASWTACSVKFAVKNKSILPITCATPRGFGTNADVTIHTDAGSTDTGVSYQHPTEWICFCLGKFTALDESFWTWVILPPASAIIKPN